MRPKNFLESLNCAAEGVIHALKTQTHLKIHFIFFILLIILSLALNISIYDFVILMLLSAIVIVSELFNTAIEYMMDIFTKDFHITVKYVKDISAGAVLFVSLISMLLGMQILSKYFIFQSPNVAENMFFISISAVFLSVIAVVFLKAVNRTGRPFLGGMPSGHAAVSFSLFVSIYLATDSLILIIIAFLVTIIVSFSRFYRGIHKRAEVLYGAFLGTIITLLLHKLFYR